jgi:hypothetical protein
MLNIGWPKQLELNSHCLAAQRRLVQMSCWAGNDCRQGFRAIGDLSYWEIHSMWQLSNRC